MRGIWDRYRKERGSPPFTLKIGADWNVLQQSLDRRPWLSLTLSTTCAEVYQRFEFGTSDRWHFWICLQTQLSWVQLDTGTDTRYWNSADVVWYTTFVYLVSGIPQLEDVEWDLVRNFMRCLSELNDWKIQWHICWDTCKTKERKGKKRNANVWHAMSIHHLLPIHARAWELGWLSAYFIGGPCGQY